MMSFHEFENELNQAPSGLNALIAMAGSQKKRLTRGRMCNRDSWNSQFDSPVTLWLRGLLFYSFNQKFAKFGSQLGGEWMAYKRRLTAAVLFPV